MLILSHAVRRHPWAAPEALKEILSAASRVPSVPAGTGRGCQSDSGDPDDDNCTGFQSVCAMPGPVETHPHAFSQ